MNIIWMGIGFLAALYLPAPYEAIVRAQVAKLWARVTGGVS